MRKFLIPISFLILPLLTLVLCITIIKDPGEIVSNRYLDTKDILIEGHNVRLYSVPSQWAKFQEAYLQERKIRKMPALDIVAWSSSRSSELRADLFPTQNYYNCVIPGSHVLDYVALYGLYKKYDALPKTIVLNIDPWTFYARKEIIKEGKVYYVREHKTDLFVKDHLNFYLEAGMKELHQPLRGFSTDQSLKAQLLRYVELVSPSYFQSSLKVITLSSVAVTKENYIHNYFVLRKDGSYTLYDPSPVDIENLKSRAVNFGKLAQGDFYGDDCVEGEDMKLFLSLLDKLEEQGIQVILFISPIHPSLYKTIEGYEKKLVEQKLNALAKERKMLVIGSFNPNVYPLNGSNDDPDFIDEYHASYKTMKTIFDYHQPEIKEYFSTRTAIQTTQLPLEEDSLK